MRAGLAKAVCTQMLNTPAMTVDGTCEASIRENILEGQPAAIPCPHKDCGILAVRVNTSGGSCSDARSECMGSKLRAGDTYLHGLHEQYLSSADCCHVLTRAVCMQETGRLRHSRLHHSREPKAAAATSRNHRRLMWRLGLRATALPWVLRFCTVA